MGEQSHIMINESIDTVDSLDISKPNNYVFMFINPNSGGRKGLPIVDLKIQHFRLKSEPLTQVQIYNILDESQSQEGMRYLKSIVDAPPEEFKEKSCKVHVWSGGGDGTIIGVVEKLVSYKIDFNKVYFSCIPLGTGNDFSQVMGWGKTLVETDVLGRDLGQLSTYIKDRLDKFKDYRTSLDIWDIKIDTYDGGYIKKIVKKDQKSEKVDKEFSRKMCVYFALGVQGYVGKGFEAKRTKSRLNNFFVYAYESMKWIVFKKFTPVTKVLETITTTKSQSDYVLKCEKTINKNSNEDISVLKTNPIEIVVQNIPRIWSTDIDLWSDSKLQQKDDIENRAGPTDPKNWSKQKSNDRKLEVFSIDSVKSYAKLLTRRNENAGLIGQFEDCFNFNFRNRPKTLKNYQRNSFRKLFRRPVPESEDSYTSVMIDGEFYEIYRPKRITFNHFIDIMIVCNDEDKSRLIRDEQEI